MINFFPRDTRVIETVAGFSSLWAGLGVLLLNVPLPAVLEQAHNRVFWGIILSMIGSLQIASSTMFCDNYPMRAILTWITGLWFVWVSLSMLTPTIELTFFTIFSVGIYNLYAFLINFLTVAKKWMN